VIILYSSISSIPPIPITNLSLLFPVNTQTKHVMASTVRINEIDYDLDQLLKHIWKLLVRVPYQKNDPYRTPVLATFGNKGLRQRTVVLRKVDELQYALIFHTDIRSGKIQDMKSNQQVHWLFWDAKRNIQLRMKGIATIHTTDEVATQLWNDESPASLKLYLSNPGPGTVVEQPRSGLPVAAMEKHLQHKDVQAGKENFAAIETQINEIDWLWLNPSGHRRAAYIFQKGVWEGSWVIP